MIAAIGKTHAIHPKGTVLAVVFKPLGDLVCLIPQLRYLARRSGRPVEVLTVHGWAADLFRGVDGIGRVHATGGLRLPLWLTGAEQRIAGELSKSDIRQIHVFGSPRRRKLNAAIGILRRAGLGDLPLVSDLPEWSRPEARLPGDAPDADDLRPVSLLVTEAERNAMRARLRNDCSWRGGPVVWIHYGNGRTAMGWIGSKYGGGKWWAPDNWRKVLAGVREQLPDATVILTGTDAERRFAGKLAKAAGGAANRVYAWAGATSIREILALQSLAHSGIAIDTGTAHTASGVGCPQVVLYGAEDPRVRFCPPGWGPVATIRGGNPYEVSDRKIRYRLIGNIRPETVLRLWRELPPRPSGPTDFMPPQHYLETAEVPAVSGEGNRRWVGFKTVGI